MRGQKAKGERGGEKERERERERCWLTRMRTRRAKSQEDDAALASKQASKAPGCGRRRKCLMASAERDKIKLKMFS